MSQLLHNVLINFDRRVSVSARWRGRHQGQKVRWLRMDFATFRKGVLQVPTQIVLRGRRRIFRFLGWRPELTGLMRLLDGL